MPRMKRPASFISVNTVLCTRARIKRIENGLSQRQVAEAMGFASKVSVTRFERGLQTISAVQLYELAKLLGTTPSWLLGFE